MDTSTKQVHTPSSLPVTQTARRRDLKDLKVDDAYLDAFLGALKKDGTPVSRSVLTCNYDILRGDLFTAKNLLIEKGLITEHPRKYLPPSYSLTPLGKQFLDNGGFGYKQRLKETLETNRLARAAIIISVIAGIVGIAGLVLLMYLVRQ